MATCRGSITLLLVLASSILVYTQQQSITRCRGELDLIIAIDGSNSMGQPNFRLQLNSVANMVNNLDVSPNNVHVGALLYSLEVETPIIPLSSNKMAVVNGIRGWHYPDQETRTDLAISEAMDMFQMDARRGSVPQILIVITDGASTIPSATLSAANDAKRQGIQIFAVGVSGARNEIDMNELRAIASDPNQVMVTPDFQTLENTLNAATERICVNLGCDRAVIDLVFMLDSSTSLGPANFELLKNFVIDFLFFAHIHVGNIRVGLMTYSDTPIIQFGLLDFIGNENGMNQAIRSIQYQPGSGTNIAAAFQMVRQQMYTAANGDRQYAPDVVIFVTSSMATIDQGRTRQEAEATRAAGIQVIGIGVDLPSTRDLDYVTSQPFSENRFMVPSCDQIRSVIQPIYRNFNRFCADPPPVPACFMGQTDIWYVTDLSMTAERLSRFDVINDFARLKNGLMQPINIALDPSVANPGVRMGLVTYSDQPQKVVSPSEPASVSRAAQAVNAIPGFVRVGGSNIIPALQQITTPPQQSRWNSYVAIVTPQSAFNNNFNIIQNELNRLRQLGYTIVLFTVRDQSIIPPQQLVTAASAPQFFYYLNDYKSLEAATKNFTRDVLCAPPPPPPPPKPTRPPQQIIAGMCARTRYQQTGMDVLPHPTDCDKYIQCYMNSDNRMDIAVVRTCPRGLFWTQAARSCLNPDQANCPTDKCREGCSDYRMDGGPCNMYWSCVGGRSQVKCCRPMFAFKQGKGCVFDPTCNAECAPGQWCGMCMKRPNYRYQYGYDVLLGQPNGGPNPAPPGFSMNTPNNNMGGVSLWAPRHCDYKYFDIVTCKCTKDMNAVCPADRSYNFRDGTMVQQMVAGRVAGIRVKDVTPNPAGITLGPNSELHVDANKAAMGSPFSVTLRFSEGRMSSAYGQVLLTSGMNCGHSRGLVVSMDDRFIRARAYSNSTGSVVVKVPYQGIAPGEFKTLGISYAKKELTLYVLGRNHQYIARSKAPADICIPCGIDLGGALNKQSFTGQVEAISVYSCPIQLNYA